MYDCALPLLFTGTSANDIHFQAFLIDGICRWNAERASAAINSSSSRKTRSFDVKLQDRLNKLTCSVLGRPADPNYRPPALYTGELFGVEYLYNEIGGTQKTLDVDKDIEEGMDADKDIYPKSPIYEGDLDLELNIACSSMTEPTESVDDLVDEDNSDENLHAAVDSRSIEGWDKVDQLATKLIESEGLSITNIEAETIIHLYDQLSPYDKEPLTYARKLQPSRGRFARLKNSSGHVGVEAMKRCFITGGSPSLPPSKSRVVEAICLRLFNKITTGQKDPYVSRYALIIQKYNEIRNRIMLSPIIVQRTKLALYSINETTISLW